MQRITYALRFYRAPKSTEVPSPQATAPSVQITSVIGPDGVAATFDAVEGQTAVMTNTAVVDHTGQLFFEWGTINFAGEDNTLSFSSIGAGSLLGPPDAEGFSQGTVMWRVDSGTGTFEAATGAITSNFLVNLDTDELIDYQFHLIYLP
ncbi:MAG TPA: hypothetical protein VF952_19760 [Chloroflexia bacterium]